jgi:hypothetical protein
MQVFTIAFKRTADAGDHNNVTARVPVLQSITQSLTGCKKSIELEFFHRIIQK